MVGTIEAQALVLKKGEDKRLRGGHLWVFSNEIDVKRSPLTDFQPGQIADVMDAGGRPVGTALVNPNSLICARLISRQAGVNPDANWFGERIRAALALRRRLYPEPYYRLVFGESDGLPGLVIDRFDRYLVAQANTAGMDRMRGVIEQAMAGVLQPDGVLWRNDASVRELEGLKRAIEPGLGRMPGQLNVVENGLRFAFEPMNGQKTGWYFDQQHNRQRVLPLLADMDRVADLYAYHGAWGLGAARLGVAEVICVDSSQAAVNAIRSNALANDLAARVNTVQADAERWLSDRLAAGERFDAVIVDPPAFAPRARDVKVALSAYRRINEKALRLLRPGGLLVSCSCSAHVFEERFVDTLRQAARHIDRDLQVVMRLEQAPDHPVLPAMPFTRYLKGVAVRVMPSY